MSKQDNPVPSLDNLILKLRDIRNSDNNIPIKVYNQLCDIEKDFIKLQNGVETKNEQPNECFCSSHYITGCNFSGCPRK